MKQQTSLEKFIAHLESHVELTESNYGSYVPRCERQDLKTVVEMLKITQDMLDVICREDFEDELNRLAEGVVDEKRK